MKSAILKPINHADPEREFNLNETSFVFIYDVRDYSVCTVQAIGENTWSTAILAIERSNDGKTPVSLETGATSLTAPGMTNEIQCSGFGYLHVRLSTAEGSAKTCVIRVEAKDSPPKGATGATGAAGNSYIAKTMTADQSTASNTTLTNVTDLAFSIGASETWVYRFSINAGNALSTTGAKVAATVPSGATMWLYAVPFDDTNDAVIPYGKRATSSGVAADLDAIGVFQSAIATPQIMVDLYVKNSTNAGTVQLQFAQSTSSVTNLTFKQGSFGVGFKQ